MNRYTSLLFRAYLPAAVLLVVAVGSMVWISVAGNVDMLNGWVRPLRLLPPIALLASLVMAGIATLRMWRVAREDALICAACAAPLGRLQHGRDGDNRKCVSCAAVQCESTAGQ